MMNLTLYYTGTWENLVLMFFRSATSLMNLTIVSLKINPWNITHASHLNTQKHSEAKIKNFAELFSDAQVEKLLCSF